MGLFNRSKADNSPPHRPSTAPSSLGGSSSLRRSTIQSRLSQSPDPGVIDGTATNNGRRPLWKRLFGNCLSIYKLRRWLRSRFWKGALIFCSFFLLFGSQIQHLWIAPTEETVFDVLSSITFCFFLLDMIVRILAEPNYFQFRTCCTGERDFSSNITFNLGSFMFWCDLVSTGVTLYDISFINPGQYSIIDVDIILNGDGFPTSGFDTFDRKLNRLRAVNLEIDLLITIARCARVARFVQSRTVVNASNKIHWYWIFNQCRLFNPIRHWKRLRKQRRQAHLASLGVGEESVAFVVDVKEDKRSSWGVLQIGILAAVRAQAEAEAREAKDAKKSGFRFWNTLKQSLRSIGLMESEKYLQMRHEAASKIQRAWKAHMKFETTASNDGGSLFGDLASDNDESLYSHRAHAVNPIGKILSKRSAMGTMANMNARAGGKLDRDDIKHSLSRNERAPESRFQSQAGKGRESQVGSDMRELTGQRVAIGVVLALVFTVFFTYTESNTTRPTTMVVLHEQTMNSQFQMEALYTARNTSTPDLYFYEPADGVSIELEENNRNLRDREKLRVTITDDEKRVTTGYFAFRTERVQEAVTELVATVFIILMWFFGVTAFAGPVMSLVVIPIERMVRLLGMLMLDPLGYQSTARFKKFLIEEDALIKNTRWTKEVLKGMETSFLMSTILRIGSLMKVGFGSAGVEIIRNNLQQGQSKNMLKFNSQGSTVSCIFLFCDIRSFTDATECLQEEVFVFTNRIAAVIHSICHSYGGAANKNVGDAFFLTWSLEDGENNRSAGSRITRESKAPLRAKSNQADKALLSVIKICISLYYDNYYMEPLSDSAKNRLKGKLKNRPGPVVQMGFGLHAGKAVQGAIGSQRKIDATYVSEAVERAEFLESSTKQYGLKMLMSDSFHRLLHPNTRRRCRKIDQVLIQDDEEDEDEDDDEIHGERMDLYTFDMDVAAIHRPQFKIPKVDSDTLSDAGSVSGERRPKRVERRMQNSARQLRNRRRSIQLRPLSAMNGSEELNLNAGGNDNLTVGSPSIGGASVSSIHSADESNNPNFPGPPELVLPTGPALYSHNVWQSPDMKRIRDKFVQGLFFQKFNSGLQAYYNKDWDTAKQCFQTVLDHFDDGPSKYFLDQIKEHNGVPPNDFLEYGLA